MFTFALLPQIKPNQNKSEVNPNISVKNKHYKKKIFFSQIYYIVTYMPYCLLYLTMSCYVVQVEIVKFCSVLFCICPPKKGKKNKVSKEIFSKHKKIIFDFFYK